MTTISNIQKLEQHFGVKRVLPHTQRSMGSTNYVHIPEYDANTPKAYSFTFGAGTIQKYIGNKKCMSIIALTDSRKMIIFYPNDNGEYTISRSKNTATLCANGVLASIPKVARGRYVPESIMVDDVLCFAIKYEEY